MYGLDHLGLAKYADLAIREHPEGWACGVFATTFGPALPHVDRLLATGRCPLVRVHLLWSDTHSFGDADIPAIRKLARQYQQLKQKYPSVTVQVSPCCEHNLRDPDKYLTIVANEAPDCVPINTPFKGAFSKQFHNEIHGTHSKPPGCYNYSHDGSNGPDSNMEALKVSHKSADVFFIWGVRMNGNWNMATKIPRPARKGWPDSRYLDSLIALSRTKGETKLPRRWLFKSHAENKGNGDARAEKPVWVIPFKLHSIELRARNGQVIDKARYYGPFTDGRYRYYHSDWGYLLADKAVRIQGDSCCEVWAGREKVGIVDPIFRDGSWRE